MKASKKLFKELIREEVVKGQIVKREKSKFKIHPRNFREVLIKEIKSYLDEAAEEAAEEALVRLTKATEEVAKALEDRAVALEALAAARSDYADVMDAKKAIITRAQGDMAQAQETGDEKAIARATIAAKNAALSFTDQEAAAAKDLADKQEAVAKTTETLQTAVEGESKAYEDASTVVASADHKHIHTHDDEYSDVDHGHEGEPQDKEEKEAERRSYQDKMNSEKETTEKVEEASGLMEQDTSLRQGHTATKPSLFEAEAALVIKDTVNIDDIYTEIRAIEGVTVVSTDVKKQSVGVSREKSMIKIKFMKGRRSLQHYISLLIRTMMRVNGVINVKMVSTKKLEL